MVYNCLHIHLWFLDVGMGFENSRPFAIIQASSSFEGIYLSHFLSSFINLFRFSVMLSYPHVYLNFQGGDAVVNSVHLFPKNSDHIVVCNKSSSIFIMTLQGQVLQIPLCYSTSVSCSWKSYVAHRNIASLMYRLTWKSVFSQW
jgi:hypothetical protein